MKLSEQIEANEGTVSDKVLAFCERNPSIVMTLLDKLDKMGLGRFMSDDVKNDIANQTTNA